VQKLRTFGEWLPRNPGRYVVQQLQRVLSIRRSRVESVAPQNQEGNFAHNSNFENQPSLEDLVLG
jgi:hypothetical protein